MFSFYHAEGMSDWVSNRNLMLGYNPSTHEPLLRYRLRTRVCLSLRQAELSQILEEFLKRTCKSIERDLDSRSSVPRVLRNTEAH